jgi:prepilin-type N-terminal cleavage/methylation domain-containing protein
LPFGGGGNLKAFVTRGFQPVGRAFNPAFTLAEVLITLGIIGVVAAMTIPTLMAKINEQQTVSKLKKAQSTLANAYRLMENDDEYPLSECVSLGTFGTRENYAKNCFATLGKYFKVANISYPGNLNSEMFEKNKPNCFWTIDDLGILQTLDGTIFYFDGVAGIEQISVDVNGLNKPNEGGKDVFTFDYTQYNNNGKKQLTYNLIPASGTCTKTNYSNWCTAQVLQTGKMDYLK